MYTPFFENFQFSKKVVLGGFRGRWSRIWLYFAVGGFCTKIYHENVNILKILIYVVSEILVFSINWLNMGLRDPGLLEFPRLVDTEELATEFALNMASFFRTKRSITIWSEL